MFVPGTFHQNSRGRTRGAKSFSTGTGCRASRFLDRRLREEDVANEDVSEVIGFLSSHGVLYCSQACASSHGVSAGYDVDQDEYESLVESESLPAVGLCPGCGAEFPVSWLEREPN
jgi:hypothetical protein